MQKFACPPVGERRRGRVVVKPITPPFRWLTNQRIVRAKELLQDPGHELSDIAQLCGFVDQSHFTRVFCKSEGYSPGRWRRLHRC